MTDTLIALISIFIGLISANVFGFYNKNIPLDLLEILFLEYLVVFFSLKYSEGWVLDQKQL